MALIKCPECGREISDKAQACIHCGYPLADIKPVDASSNTLSQRKNMGKYSIQVVDYGDKKVKIATVIKSITGITSTEALLMLKEMPCYIVTNVDANTSSLFTQELDALPIEYKLYKETECVSHKLKEEIKEIEKTVLKPKETIQCPSCKKTINITSRVCEYCGFDGISSYLLQRERGKQTHFSTSTTTNNNVGGSVNNKPHCPHCHSTNISAIGTGERVGSIAMWGIFSKKINKSFKCKDCGYTW